MKYKISIAISLFFTLNIFSQNIDVTEIEINFSDSSNPQNITKGINKIYFSANDGINGNELWVHNVYSNTSKLVKDIAPGSNSGIYTPQFITIGDILYFMPDLYSTGTKLWRSDGTETGTYMLKEISANSPFNTVGNLFVYEEKLIFTASDPINGNEIWISDGTSIGTKILKNINPGLLDSNPSNFTILNGLVYFTASTATNGRELWRTDGTSEGTQLVIDIDAQSTDGIIAGKFIVLNNMLYFFAYTSEYGYEIWRSDGTSSGTQLFKDINPGPENSNGILMTATDNYFVFTLDSYSIGTELWKCDGTLNGTELLKDINPGVSDGIPYDAQFAVLNNNIYFNAINGENNEELWKTDGTSSGTLLVKDINPGSNGSNIEELTATSNYLIFSAFDNSHTYNSLWKSDGTEAGTYELKDTNLSQFSNTKLSFVELNNLVFFPAGYDSLNGTELWVTDGTSTNTRLFLDIFHAYGGMTSFYDTAEFGNKLIFTGNNGKGNEPFITDGTISGTKAIRNIDTDGVISFFSSSGFRSASYTKAGNHVFFRASSPNFGFEIWKTDGTAANTSMVKDIKPGNTSSISEYPLFMELNGIFYFKADDGIHGEELWRSDGTSDGTYMVKDIYPGSGHAFNGQSNIYYNHYEILNEKCFAVLNGYLYFTADDGTGNSIWRTDGTQNGTVKVIVIPNSGPNDSRRVIINSNDQKIFFKTNTNIYGGYNNSLWSSDGTQAGSVLLYQTDMTSPLNFKKTIIHNNNLYFVVYGNNGKALVKSDGTLGGTITIAEGFNYQDTFNSLISCGDYVYFGVGFQGITSRELWRTDGTPSGTIKLGDSEVSGNESFYNCDTCYKNNLIFKKNSYNDDRIFYVNGNSTNTDSYLTTNIMNSEDFGENGYHIYSDFFAFNDKLLFAGAKQYSGNELYSSVFDVPLSTKDIKGENNLGRIMLFPNPADSKVKIKTLDDSVILNLKIYDILGKEIITSNLNFDELDVSHLKEGIYLIKIVTDKLTTTNKLVIKK